MRLLNAYKNNWFYVGGIIFVVLSYVLGIWGDDIDPLKRLMTLTYMSLLLHQFEEYAMPGGFPSAFNQFSGEYEKADRFPLNTKSAFIVNICIGYVIYIGGIVFSDIALVCIVICYMNIAQAFIHVLAMNRKLKTIYNPGVASVIFVMIPLSVYTLWFIATNYVVPTWNWWVGILLLPPLAFVSILAPVLVLKDKDTTHVFGERDTKGFSIKSKVARIRRG